MRLKPFFQLTTLGLLLTLSLAAGCGSKTGTDSREGQSSGQANVAAVAEGVGSNPGDIAPDFTLKRLDGSDLNLASLRGKVVIVDFWDTWCPPCRRAMPHLQELSETYGDDLVVVGVAFGREGADKVRSYTRENELTFEMVLFEQSSSILTDFGGIQSIPTTFLIGADGVIREKWVGGNEKRVYEQAVIAAIAARS